MNYPEGNGPSMNPDNAVDRLHAKLEAMTHESYEQLAAANRNRRLASIDWRIAKLEHLFNQREQQR